ncbi:MAG: rhomboid family intramembrane serine protease [Proteobacteria bacterium]|nr:rhomboid family intramembrane serine protease [Pseudomonadota bacterium]
MFPALTPATRAIILVNVLVFILESVAMQPILLHFALWPLGPDSFFRPWQLVTYAFLHDGVLHIFFNMFALYVFGPALEQYWGPRRYVGYYFVCVIAAGATQLAVEQLTGSPGATIGASGGIFGILLAFAILFPRVRLLLYFAIPMPAWLFVSGYAVLELLFGVTGTEAGIAHFAHLGGMLGGAVMMLYWRLRADRGGWRRS